MTESPPAEAPPSVVLAVRLMLGVVALNLVGIVVVATARDSVREILAKAYPAYSESRLDDAVSTAVTSVVVGHVLFVVLYLLLARQVAKGKNWARITTLVFGALGVLGALNNLATDEVPSISRAIAVLGMALNIGIIVLLARKESRPFFSRRIR